jgi:hypothetical protein
MTQLPATVDENVMVETVAHWFDLAAELLPTESSRRYMQALLKRLIRQGTIEAARVIAWANDGVADADIALRQVCSEMLDQGEKPPATIAGYAAVALNKPPVARRKGGDAVDNWLRDQCVTVFVSMAVERWYPHLPPSRNRFSKTPSACSVVSQALIRRRINIGERRVETITKEYLDLLPMHRAWRASLISASNAGL